MSVSNSNIKFVGIRLILGSNLDSWKTAFSTIANQLGILEYILGEVPKLLASPVSSPVAPGTSVGADEGKGGVAAGVCMAATATGGVNYAVKLNKRDIPPGESILTHLTDKGGMARQFCEMEGRKYDVGKAVYLKSTAQS
ncbi:hypothetical protein HDU93_005396 [Gonapodya sp. JEL0774]|nr:hypothetical protein HDU93_005396 [Gonapodya sp. JEL0774]